MKCPDTFCCLVLAHSLRRVSYLNVDIRDPSVILLLLRDVQSGLLGQLTEQVQSFPPWWGEHQRRALDRQLWVLYNSQLHDAGRPGQDSLNKRRKQQEESIYR